jgi:hypothetical protein
MFLINLTRILFDKSHIHKSYSGKFFFPLAPLKATMRLCLYAFLLNEDI